MLACPDNGAGQLVLKVPEALGGLPVLVQELAALKLLKSPLA